MPFRRKRPTRSAIIPYDGYTDYIVTADTVLDDPRQPRIEPMGILDHRGNMFVRVTLPITQRCGFAIPGRADVEDEVTQITTANMLSVSDDGSGLTSIEEDDLDWDEED